MEENRIEAMENENVELIEVDNDDVENYDETEVGSGMGIAKKVGIVLGVGAAIGLAAKTVGPKIKTGCENFIVNTAEKIKAKRELAASKYDEVEVDAADVDVIDVEAEEE